MTVFELDKRVFTSASSSRCTRSSSLRGDQKETGGMTESGVSCSGVVTHNSSDTQVYQVNNKGSQDFGLYYLPGCWRTYVPVCLWINAHSHGDNVPVDHLAFSYVKASFAKLFFFFSSFIFPPTVTVYILFLS